MGRSQRILLDSTILYILAGKNTEFPDAFERMVMCLEEHKQAGDPIHISTPSIAECFHLRDTVDLARFRVLNFNVKAAQEANRLIPMFKESKARDQESVLPLKIDAMILATALAWEIDILYTTDSQFAKVVARNNLPIEVRDLPLLPARQGGLFDSTP